MIKLNGRGGGRVFRTLLHTASARYVTCLCRVRILLFGNLVLLLLFHIMKLTNGKKSLVTGLVIAAAVMTAALVSAGIYAYVAVTTPMGGGEHLLYINEGTTRESLYAELASAYGSENARITDTMLKLRKRRPNRYPGCYLLDGETTPLQLFRLLTMGDESTVNYTFNNIRTKREFAEATAKYLNMPADTIAGLLGDTAVCRSLGFDTVSIISMFLPDTYQVFRSSSPQNFMKRMKREYDAFWNDKRKGLAENAGLTPYEVSILASIVEEETKIPDEMNRVAGLYINRLRRGMLLQADPTVKFAVGDFSLQRILNRHLETDSPYNTYKYPGLPPGPIRIPSKTALNAVLNYEENNYLYMCAREDFSGRHNFASSLGEHNRNAARYRNALNRLNIK